jgi:hypothetical protein
MAINSENELIWEGRIQIGDEPGTFTDADYSGICTELPITVYRTNPQDFDDTPFRLVLETQHLETFAGYPGHLITVFIHNPDPDQPYHSIEHAIVSSRFTSDDNNYKEIEIPLETSGPFFLSLRLRADTSVNPGLYNDFVLLRLSVKPDLESLKYFAGFGFRNI